jgi:carbonic anhydrase
MTSVVTARRLTLKVSWLVASIVCGLLGCKSQVENPQPTTTAKPAWSYEGRTGPDHWGELSSDYVLAKTGRRQSPVDIVRSKAIPKDGAPLDVSYESTSLEILNNGHTIEDEYHDGGMLVLDGRQYHLAQFHFHSPSEHTIDGKHAPMELHLVHKDAGGSLAVIGVLIQEGRAHPELNVLWPHLPKEPGRKVSVPGVMADASKLLPGSLASYRYTGSLTSPPCSEDVSWVVLQQPIEASPEQIAAFRKLIHGNNRPTQPLNGRTITASN